MTIRQILREYSAKLKSYSSSPILDIELLLTKTLNQTKEYLFEYPETKLTQPQLNKFKKLHNRRKKGEPIAYILGHKEFYNLDFIVNKNVLIPRPETELLVEEVLKYYKSKIYNLKSKILIAEIGVGSGAIIISLAKNIKKVKFFGTDISGQALSVAKQNAKFHKTKIKFLKGNLLDPILQFPNYQFLITNSLIVANLPYLEQKEENLLPSSDTRGLQFEPKIAWDGGKDGLKYFRKFFQQIKQYKLKPQAIFLEIGHKQGDKISKMAKLALPNYKINIYKDLCGFDRVIKITK